MNDTGNFTTSHLSITQIEQASVFNLWLNVKTKPLPVYGYMYRESTAQGIRTRILDNIRKHRRLYEPTSKRLESNGLLREIGGSIYNGAVPVQIRQALESAVDTSTDGMPLVLSTNDDNFPWELAHDGDQFLCIRWAVGRELASLGEQPRRMVPVRNWKVLLIGNPKSNLSDLPDSEKEVEEIAELLRGYKQQYLTAKLLCGTQATKEKVLASLSSGDYHLIHYSGHANFESSTKEMGLVLAGGEILTPKEIQQNLAGHPWVFLNACDSAQTNGHSGDEGLGVNSGLATAFVMGGAEVVVGTLWPVIDREAYPFAIEYYRNLLRSLTIGESVRSARTLIKAKGMLAWSAYVLYGTPATRLVETEQYDPKSITILHMRLCDFGEAWSKPHLDTAARQYDSFVQSFRDTIDSHGGEIVSSTMSNISVAFGLHPTMSANKRANSHNNGERALATALALQKQSSLSTQLHPKLAMGLAGGMVVFNQQTKMLLGGPVEGAVWLANKARPGQILADEQVIRSSRMEYETKPWVEIQASQYPKHWDIETVMEVSGEAYDRDLNSPTLIIGRGEHHGTLIEAWEKAKEGKGAVIAVTGEAGIGKTYLLSHFFHQIANSGMKRVWVRCLPGHQTVSYSTIVALVRNTLLMDKTDGAVVVQNKVRSQLCGNNASNSETSKSWARDCEWKAQVLISLLTTFDNVTTTTKVNPQNRVSEIAKALDGFLESVIESNGPIALIIEDFHNIDELSIRVLTLISGQLYKRRILCVTESISEITDYKGWKPIQLHPPLHHLTDVETKQLIARQLQGHIPDSILEKISQHVQGNPLLIVETIRALLQKCVLVERDGTWDFTRQLSESDIPKNLILLIHSRIDELTPENQEVLHKLAILGSQKDFDKDLVFHFLSLYGYKHPDEAIHYDFIDQSLHELANLNFIQLLDNEQGFNNEYYQFVHDTTRYSVIAGIPSIRRRQYHYQIADLLKELKKFRGLNEFETARLANHLYHSVIESTEGEGRVMNPEEFDPDYLREVVDTLVEAGERASRESAHHKAATYYQQALHVLSALGLGSPDNRRDAADLSRRIGRSYMHLAKWDEADGWMKQGCNILIAEHSSLEQLTDSKDLSIAALLSIHTGSILYLEGKFPLALVKCEQGMRLAERCQVEKTIAEGCKVIGAVLDAEGRSKEAIIHYLRGKTICETLQEKELLIQFEDNLATAYYALGDWDQAFELDKKGLKHWETQKQRSEIAIAAINVGMIYLNRGAWVEAEECFTGAENVCLKIEEHRYAALAKANLGFVYLGQAELEKADAWFRESLDLLEQYEINDTPTEAFSGLSEIARLKGDPIAALQHAEKALSIARENEMHMEECAALRNLGLAYLQDGKISESLALFEESLEVAGKFRFAFETGRSLIALAEYHLAIGSSALVLQNIDAALQILEPMKAAPAIEWALQLRGKLYR